LRILIIIALVACPEWAAAQDKWFAADKAQHFGAGAAAAGAGYAIAVPLTRRTDGGSPLAPVSASPPAAGKSCAIADAAGGPGAILPGPPAEP